MKSQILKMVKWFSMRSQLSAANSYINYLQSELAIKEEFARNAMIDAARSKIQERAAQHALREALAKRVTASERYFLNVCSNIYLNGKMISELRFNGMVGAFANERTRSINENCGVNANEFNKQESGKQ
ncbi:hypothetical protein [Klebsiella michiganensis]|uniref:hypothetical protein n=1 Tax=Klebsiella michiganensis TaxID=1134687 RepID=UPI001CCF1A95|nr:hypothetical protein [Klebsiella michiganensis]MBZ7392399.1 hypothetical protein [Klebsiella michiganensis]MDL4446317.1 hypothetical protein [Klebsiella michiganensis]MDL4490887.1 hypothetical protein [Klebsiella michiganensis]MDL4659630.1 hypothetical protein [Klebsiella michiganensis]